jgi:hypothetical protein
MKMFIYFYTFCQICSLLNNIKCKPKWSNFVGELKRLDVFVCEATHILARKNNGATFGFVLFSFSDKMEKQSMMCALAFQHIKQGEEQKIVSIKRLIVSRYLIACCL